MVTSFHNGLCNDFLHQDCLLTQIWLGDFLSKNNALFSGQYNVCVLSKSSYAIQREE